MKAKNLVAVALVLAAGLLLAWSFSRLPVADSRLAIDWKQIWQATHGFHADYGSTELRTPPWALPLIWPFTFFPLGLSWGLAAFATLAVLLTSVPRQAGRRAWLLGLVVLATSYLTLRQLADGNLEALVIGGILLLLAALDRKNPWLLAAGILLAAAKIQETWLLLIAMAVAIANAWPRGKLIKSLALALGFALPFLIWKGNDWLEAMFHFPWSGTAIDSSLQATFARFGIPALVYWLCWLAITGGTLCVMRKQDWRLERLEAGLLVVAGLLLAPYAASNSVLVPLAVGVIPFLLTEPKMGVFLIILYDLPFLALLRPDLRFSFESSYWTMVLIVTWLVLSAYLLRSPRRRAAS